MTASNSHPRTIDANALRESIRDDGETIVANARGSFEVWADEFLGALTIYSAQGHDSITMETDSMEEWHRAARILSYVPGTELPAEPGGYRPCACRDCMETAIGTPGALCDDCDVHCPPDCHVRECEAPHAYGC
jgi:hypothetical protein